MTKMGGKLLLCSLELHIQYVYIPYKRIPPTLGDDIFLKKAETLGLSKGYQPQPSALVDNPYCNLDYSGYHKNLNPIIVFSITQLVV